ncbi:MAG: sigma 54-interacting transcriptional regulator [candidate division WOR-3 bacterium]
MMDDFLQRVRELETQLAHCSSLEERAELLLGQADGFVVNAAPLLKPLFEQELLAAQEQGRRLIEVRLARRLSDICRHCGANEEADLYAQRVRKIGTEIGEPRFIGSGWYLAGQVEQARCNYEAAIDCYQRALTEWQKAGVVRGIYAALNGLGSVAGLTGRYHEARDYYQQCRQLLENPEFDDFVRATNYCNLGWVYLQLGEWDDAEENLYRSVALAEQQGYDFIRYNALNLLGELFLKRDRLERAVEVFTTVVEAGRKGLTAAELLRDSLTNLGEAEFRRRNYAGASRAFAEAIDLCAVNQDRLNSSMLLWRMAELELAQGNYDRCAGLCQQAQQLAKELGARNVEAEVFRVRALLEQERGMAGAACSFYERARELLNDEPESYESARLRLQFGQFLLEQNQKERAAEELKFASRVFRKLGLVAETDEVNRILFRLELNADREIALVAGIAGLALAGLESGKFIEGALKMICEAFGFDGAALIINQIPRIIYGDVNVAVEDWEQGAPIVKEHEVLMPVCVRGDVNGYVYLARRASWKLDLRTSVLETVASLLAPAVEKLYSLAEELPAPIMEIPGLRFDGVIGKSIAMRKNLEIIVRCADSSLPVLIRGESGTGKELVARAIHFTSSRSGKPFVPINCAAVPETLLEAEFFGVEKGAATGVSARKGKFELADGGTVFLDEIGDMSPGLQAKLLRVLQDKTFERVGSTRPVRVDVRVVAATNQNLEKLIQEGRFREDLYYRLNGIEIYLPPLRERAEDIPELVRFFIAKANQEAKREVRGVSPAVLRLFLAYSWPGNIRQLRNVIQRAVVLAKGEEIEIEDLPAELRHLSGFQQADIKSPLKSAKKIVQEKASAELERAMVMDCLEKANGNVKKAAELSGYSRAQFYRLIKKHNIRFRNSTRN